MIKLVNLSVARSVNPVPRIPGSLPIHCMQATELGGGTATRSVVNDGDRAGPTRRSAVHLDWKADHLESARL
jgi:hypothetical protein